MVNTSITKKIVCNVIALYSIGKIVHVLSRFHRNIRKIKENPTKNGGRLVANTLKAYGVEYVFTLTGGHISPILFECERQNIKIIDTRHEVTTVYAADAMARLTGKCGVAIVTSGPGLTNTVTAVKNAQLAESPVLIISGAAPIVQHNRGALQDIDHVGLMKTLCKYSMSVQSVRDIVPQLKLAMFIAQSGVPGPVYLEMPYDILYSYEHVTKALVPTATNISSPVGELSLLKRNLQLINIYYKAWEVNDIQRLLLFLKKKIKIVINNYNDSHSIDGSNISSSNNGENGNNNSNNNSNDSNNNTNSSNNVIIDDYYDNYKNEFYAPLKPIYPKCFEMEVATAVNVLEKAEKPVLILGSQAMLPPVTAEKLKQAVLKLGIPTFMSGMARGLLSDGPEDQKNTNIQYRFVRRQALAEADVVIIAGLPCDFRMGFGRGINKSAKVIIVNRSYETIIMNSDIYWKPTVPIVSDVGTFIKKLSDVMAQNKNKRFKLPNSFNDHLRELENKEKEKLRLKVEEAEKNSVNSKKVNPLVFLSKLNEKILSAKANDQEQNGENKTKSKNVIVVVDGGDFIGTAAKFFWPSKPLQWLDPGLFGTLGVGGGFALAASLLNSKSNSKDVKAITATETTTTTTSKELMSVNSSTTEPSTSSEIQTQTQTQTETETKTVTKTETESENENEVWLLYGDGTAGYSLAEVDTFTRHGLGVNVCIGNDSCWTQVLRQQKPLFNGSEVACVLADRHYEKVGEGYGGKGLLIGECEEEEEEEIKDDEEKNKKIETGIENENKNENENGNEVETQSNDVEENKNENENENKCESVSACIDNKLDEYKKMRKQYPHKPIVMNVLIDGKSIESFRQTSKYV